MPTKPRPIDDAERELLRTLAYSCYKRSRQVLDEFLYAKTSIPKYPYTLIEQFCEIPVPYRADDNCFAPLDQRTLEAYALYHPYARALFEDRDSIPSLPPPFDQVGRDGLDQHVTGLRRQKDWVVSLSGALDRCTWRRRTNQLLNLYRDIIDYSKSRVSRISLSAQSLKCYRYAGNNQTPSDYNVPPDQLRATMKTLLVQARNNQDIAELVLLYLLTWFPYLNEAGLHMLAYPIRTRRFYYGACVLYIAGFGGDVKKEQELCQEIEENLRGICDKVYLPVLVLGHNSFCESKVKEDLRNCRTRAAMRQSLGSCYFLAPGVLQEAVAAGTEGNVGDVIEDALFRAWGRRRRYAAEVDRLTGPLNRLKDSLVFAGKFYACPRMIKAIRDAASMSFPYGMDPGKHIPCVLVFGAQGSGKEAIADMVQLFSDSFCLKPRQKLNCGELRPPALASAMLRGFELKDVIDRGRGDPLSIILAGLLCKFEEAAGGDRAVVVYLDELNSLDAESQAALLRFLENRELTRIGASVQRKTAIGWLVLGMMNENPTTLTKELEIRRVLQAEGLFGSALAGVLYEYFRRGRRLRDDLFYRVKRNGIIEVPELRSRTEEIPIIFHTLVQKQADERWPGQQLLLRVHMDALDELTNPSLLWPGNIRQLESFARAVFLRSTAIRGEQATVVEIDARSVREALEADETIGETQGLARS